jgi:hypothetical protein
VNKPHSRRAPMDNIIQINQGETKNQLGKAFFKYPQPLHLLRLGISGSAVHSSLHARKVCGKWP